MKDQIIKSITDPVQMERLYRSNRNLFKKEFNTIYADFAGTPLVEAWNERLNSESENSVQISKEDIIILSIGTILAYFIAKLPVIAGIREEFFFPRNISFVVLPFLTLYFSIKNNLSKRAVYSIYGLFLAGAIFINTFDTSIKSDLVILSTIHLTLFLWAVTGFSFIGDFKNREKRLAYLKYNGELLVMSAMILIAGGILTAITIGLFQIIGIKIENFYFDYIAVFGLCATPILATILTQNNPQLVGRVSPVIAGIFSPIVVVMLIVFLVAIFVSGNDPYNNRDFLMIFNLLLVGVMALIFFSIAEKSGKKIKKSSIAILLTLSVVTIIVNSVALSAILFRISEWGFSPNRTAVLGANLLILINLIIVTAHLFRIITNRADISEVGRSIATYLPVYVVWTFIVTFLFPLLF